MCLGTFDYGQTLALQSVLTIYANPGTKTKDFIHAIERGLECVALGVASDKIVSDSSGRIPLSCKTTLYLSWVKVMLSIE